MMAHVQLYYHPDDSNQALEAITKIGSTLNSAQIMTLPTNSFATNWEQKDMR